MKNHHFVGFPLVVIVVIERIPPAGMGACPFLKYRFLEVKQFFFLHGFSKLKVKKKEYFK